MRFEGSNQVIKSKMVKSNLLKSRCLKSRAKIRGKISGKISSMKSNKIVVKSCQEQKGGEQI